MYKILRVNLYQNQYIDNVMSVKGIKNKLCNIMRKQDIKMIRDNTTLKKRKKMSSV